MTLGNASGSGVHPSLQNNRGLTRQRRETIDCGGLGVTGQGKVVIYALCDPRDGRVRYVGKTDNPERRLDHHIGTRSGRCARGKWLRDLHAAGLRPVLVVLQDVEEAKWQHAERRWIRRMALRFTLVNAIKGGGGGSKRMPALLAPKPEDIDRIVAFFQAEEGSGILRGVAFLNRLDTTKRDRLAMTVARTIHRRFGRFGVLDKALVAAVVARLTVPPPPTKESP